MSNSRRELLCRAANGFGGLAHVLFNSAEWQEDPYEIWRHIAGDSLALATRIDAEFHELFTALG